MPAVFFFEGEPLNVITTTYALGGVAVQTFDAEGEPYATLSVLLPESQHLPANAFFLKDYSENAAVAAAFVAAGLATPLDHPAARAGFVWVQPYQLTEKATA